jgi:hypothetical protein
MQATTQETKIENLRIHADAKAEVLAIKKEIHHDTFVEPSLTETLKIMATAYWSRKKVRHT